MTTNKHETEISMSDDILDPTKRLHTKTKRSHSGKPHNGPNADRNLCCIPGGQLDCHDSCSDTDLKTAAYQRRVDENACGTHSDQYGNAGGI